MSQLPGRDATGKNREGPLAVPPHARPAHERQHPSCDIHRYRTHMAKTRSSVN